MSGFELESRQCKDQEYGFICTSTTIDELSYCPSSEERVRNATQIVATGRRSWKTLRGKGEAVWPPPLEAALLEALEKYKFRTVGVKGNKGQNRSPMRNRFISDYIFETTGKRRTSKQVGSRLQQLRSTCKENRILKLLLPEEIPVAGTSSSGTPFQPRSPSPDSDCMSESLSPHNPQLERASVCVHISLRNGPRSSDTTFVKLVDHMPRTLHTIEPYPDMNLEGSPSVPSAPIQVELTSPISLSGCSQFFVYSNSCPIHMELVLLELVSSPNEGSGWIYRSALVPDFWYRLRLSTDPSIYTIEQIVSSSLLYNSRSSASNNWNQCFSIIYDFHISQDHGHHSAYRDRVIQRTPYDHMYTLLQPDSTPMLYNSMSNVSMGGETVSNQNDELNPWVSQVEVPNPTPVGMNFAPLSTYG